MSKKQREYVDEHLGCPSWPNCDLDSNGCCQANDADDVEWYGHRDIYDFDSREN